MKTRITITKNIKLRPNSDKLKRIMDYAEIEYSAKLLRLQFKCYFSAGLFMILKNKLTFMDWKDNHGLYKLALPVEINVGQLRKQFPVCRDTIKKAMRELLYIGLIEEIDWIKPKHSACKVVLIHNDAWIEKYDADTGKVVYSEPLSFNFGEK